MPKDYVVLLTEKVFNLQEWLDVFDNNNLEVLKRVKGDGIFWLRGNLEDLEKLKKIEGVKIGDLLEVGRLLKRSSQNLH